MNNSLEEHQTEQFINTGKVKDTTQRSTQPEYWGLYPKTQLISSKDI